MNNYTFLQEHLKLKGVLRHNNATPDRPENSAEHSWTVAVMCWVLYPELKKEYTNLNLDKMIRMAIMHDLVEIYAGDVSAWTTYEAKDKKLNEDAAAEKLFSHLEPELNTEFKALWEEFEANESPEAKVIKGIDRLAAVLQRLETRQGWKYMDAGEEDVDKLVLHRINHSQTLLNLYTQLKKDGRDEGLFTVK